MKQILSSKCLRIAFAASTSARGRVLLVPALGAVHRARWTGSDALRTANAALRIDRGVVVHLDDRIRTGVDAARALLAIRFIEFGYREPVHRSLPVFRAAAHAQILQCTCIARAKMPGAVRHRYEVISLVDCLTEFDLFHELATGLYKQTGFARKAVGDDHGRPECREVEAVLSCCIEIIDGIVAVARVQGRRIGQERHCTCSYKCRHELTHERWANKPVVDELAPYGASPRQARPFPARELTEIDRGSAQGGRDSRAGILPSWQ